MNPLVIIVDRELSRSLTASAQSRPGCFLPHEESEWRQDLKEFIDTNHGGGAS